MAWKRLNRDGAQVDILYRTSAPKKENSKVHVMAAGTELVGRFMAKTVRETDEGTFTDYVFEGDDGKVFAIGQTYILAEHFEGAEVGTRFRITYGGKEKRKGGRSLHKYDVDIDDGADTSANEPL